MGTKMTVDERARVICRKFRLEHYVPGEDGWGGEDVPNERAMLAVAEALGDYEALESQLATITAERDAMLKSGAAANTALTIAQLEAENAVYAAERERLCAPVSDEEWQRFAYHNDNKYSNWICRNATSRLIMARAALTIPAQEAQKE